MADDTIIGKIEMRNGQETQGCTWNFADIGNALKTVDRSLVSHYKKHEKADKELSAFRVDLEGAMDTILSKLADTIKPVEKEKTIQEKFIDAAGKVGNLFNSLVVMLILYKTGFDPAKLLDMIAKLGG